jgi:hypothetical protein
MNIFELLKSNQLKLKDAKALREKMNGKNCHASVDTVTVYFGNAQYANFDKEFCKNIHVTVSIEKIDEAISRLESHILELKEMANEEYAKIGQTLKDIENFNAQPITTPDA